MKTAEPIALKSGLEDRTGTIDVHGFTVRVRIIEAKNAYGRILVRVCPVAGAGSAWIYLAKVTLEARA